MSASSKKKLRSEEAAAKMTEKQLAEQKEAKKLKIYSIIFSIIIAAMLVVALWTVGSKAINTSGIIERNTVAMTVGEEKISSAEMNLYYISAINEFMNQYGSYASMFGLDTTKPLNEQMANEESGTTWADDFLNSAKESVKATYAMVAEAKANGYTLSEEEMHSIDHSIEDVTNQAVSSGYGDLKTFLKAMYGPGCNEKLFRHYLETSTLAQSYYTHYSNSLTYEDADLREAEKENFNEYSSFTYNSYILNASKFLTGGTTDEEGNTSYTDEEKAASVKAAEDAAKALTADEIVTVEDLDAAIAGLEINAEAENAASSAYVDNAYGSVTASIREWISDSSRKEGDKTYIANTTTSTDAEGKEVTTTTGYTVVMYKSTNDNAFALANVRHILVSFEGGTTGENGSVTYSDEEKAAAKTKAEELLAAWNAGEATEESFAALATENTTDPGSKENGGLYEDVYPGQMVVNFNDWCFDEARKVGDTGIVETNYGYHVMFYSGDSETTYRDYMLTNDLRSEDTEAFYHQVLDAVTATDGDFSKIPMDLVLGGAQY